MNKRELKANVLRGVKLLDEKDPYWWNGGENTPPAIVGMVGHIDLDELDLNMPRACVLGQRHVDGYDAGLNMLGLVDGDDGDVVESSDRYGFSAYEYPNDSLQSWSFLTELWTAVIQSRRFPEREIASDPFCVKANKSWVRTQSEGSVSK